MSLYIIKDQDIISLNYNYPFQLPKNIRSKIIDSLSDKIKKGDIIAFINKIGKYNKGKSIYDGEDIISLYKKVDKNGTIPPIFFLSEVYNHTYWQKEITILKNGEVINDKPKGLEYIYYGPLISHNGYIWVNIEEKYEELRLNLKKTNPGMYVTSFAIKGIGKYYLEIEDKKLFFEFMDKKLPLPVETDLHHPDFNILYFPKYTDGNELYTCKYKLKGFEFLY